MWALYLVDNLHTVYRTPANYLILMIALAPTHMYNKILGRCIPNVYIPTTIARENKMLNTAKTA